MVDQLLELHTNLTSVQVGLLEILHEQLDEAEKRETQQRVVQQQWNEFTTSLEGSLESLSVNTTSLMRELFMGLLRLRSFIRESTRYVGEELKTLEIEVRSLREQTHRVHEDLTTLGTNGISKIEELGEISLDQMLTVISRLL